MKRRMKFTNLIGFLLTMLLLLGTVKPLTAFAGFDNNVKNGVCVVACYIVLADDPSVILEGGHGTGFFIGEDGKNPEYLVTNNHVIDLFMAYGKGEKFKATINGRQYVVRATVRVYFSGDDYVEARVIDCDETADIAILRIGTPTDERIPLHLHTPEDNEVGETVWCVGYPGIADNAAFEADSKWGINDASVTSGTLSRLSTLAGTGVKAIQTDAQINHGNSGGPMVLENGSVIGLNSWGISNEEGESENYAVSIAEVIPVLRKHNISFVEEGGSEVVKDNDDTDHEDEEDDRDRDRDRDNEKSGNTGLIIGIVAVVAVGAVVAAAVSVNSKKKSATAQQQAQAAAQQAQASAASAQPAKKAILRSMSPQHNGMMLAVHSAPIMIGRDPANCKLVYKEGTQGVSGKHCTVSYDAVTGDFLVTDLRSTYGTFLMNGQKLNANVPFHLKSGESFYVGDPTNVIRVELV